MMWVALVLLLTAVSGCANECVMCTGPTAPREYCAGDYQFRNDYNSDVQAYRDAGGECE